MTVNDDNESFVTYCEQKLTRDKTDPDKWFVQYDNKNWELLVDAEEECVYFDGIDFTISEIDEGLAEWVCGPSPGWGLNYPFAEADAILRKHYPEVRKAG